MSVIDRSQEVDIDIGVPADEQEIKLTQDKAPVPAQSSATHPLFAEMEEEESENKIEEKQSFPDYKTKEKAFYETLSEVEKEAWDRGWRTGEFFKGRYKDGSPRPHKTAEEFLAMQEKETPVLNERNRKLTKEKTALENQVAELQKQMQLILNIQKSSYEKDTQKNYASLDEAEEAAILEGDVAKVRAIRKQREDLEKTKISFEEPQIEQPKAAISRDDKDLMDNWVADNTWFHQNKVMQAAATAFFGELSERIPLQERLEMVSDEIHQRFSDKLGISKAPKVDSGVRGMQTGKKQYSYNDLPAEVRKACEFQAKRHGFSKEQIARMQQDAIKDYFN